MSDSGLNRPQMTLRQKVWHIHWMFVLLLSATAGIGFAMLYSAAGGSFDPWASRQMVRFAAGLALLVAVAVI
ncbi:MAG: rod shape-determining protein RodA, partial [Rhodospirillales bacterium]|nr:rod shape-determining protein RodA [Rhodospirillales bacterium]